MQLEEWSEHVLSLAGERFERRLAQEVAGLEIRLRQEMQTGFTALRKKLSELRAETLKWSLGFSIGQLAAIAGLLSFMLRTR